MPPEGSSDVKLSAAPSVLHSIPGRLRLRLEPADADRGEEFARALLAREGVRRAVWNRRTRSLTIHYDPCGQETAALPANPRRRSEVDAPLLGRVDLSRLLISCVLAMVPLGPLESVMIALATSLLEEPRKRPETTGGRP